MLTLKKKSQSLKEAIKLSNKLAINFSRNKKINKIHLLRNKSLKIIKNKKILTHKFVKKHSRKNFK